MKKEIERAKGHTVGKKRNRKKVRYERKEKKMKTESKRKKINNKKYRKTKNKLHLEKKLHYSNIFQDSNVLSKC